MAIVYLKSSPKYKKSFKEVLLITEEMLIHNSHKRLHKEKTFKPILF